MASIFVHNKGFALRCDSNQNIINSFHESGHTAPFSSVNVHPSPQGKNSSHQNVQEATKTPVPEPYFSELDGGNQSIL